MPATDYQGSSAAPFGLLGRSLVSLRRDQDHAVQAHDSPSCGLDFELESFQRHAADLLLDLSSSTPAATAAAASEDDDVLLSLSWIRRLLDSFLICLEQFRAVLFHSPSAVARPPLDRLVADFFDRAVKALDVCNAIRDGLDQLRQWRQLLDIAAAALSPAASGAAPLGEGQLRRAHKALTDLTTLMLDDKEAAAASAASSHRNRSFGRGGNKGHRRRTSGGGSHFRSLSWSVSQNWSAARQLQAIGGNLAVPRSNEVTATGGLATAVFTMNAILFFVMWALVAAFPCQDRGLQTHFTIPRSFPWAAPLLSLYDKILEESKRKDRKNSCGLLKEIHEIERCSRQLAEVTDAVQSPLNKEKAAEFRAGAEQLARVCEALKAELDPIERLVREVFHRIVKSRTEGFECLNRPHNPEHMNVG